ncbi:MAG: hypothetical protein ABR981_04925, partial [Candidatus Micrarchaeaceae archaeon]
MNESTKTVVKTDHNWILKCIDIASTTDNALIMRAAESTNPTERIMVCVNRNTSLLLVRNLMNDPNGAVSTAACEMIMTKLNDGRIYREPTLIDAINKVIPTATGETNKDLRDIVTELISLG